jgi:hypothetical protein
MFRRFFGASPRPQKEPHSADEDDEALLSSSNESLPVTYLANGHGKAATTIALRTALLCTAVYFGIGIWLGLIVKNTRFINDVDTFCLHHISQYCVSISSSTGAVADIIPAPVVNEVKPNWHTIRYNGTFFHENIYRQAASPEVDAAWEALGVDCETALFS